MKVTPIPGTARLAIALGSPRLPRLFLDWSRCLPAPRHGHPPILDFRCSRSSRHSIDSDEEMSRLDERLKVAGYELSEILVSMVPAEDLILGGGLVG
jgi:hypothetical protein